MSSFNPPRSGLAASLVQLCLLVLIVLAGCESDRSAAPQPSCSDESCAGAGPDTGEPPPIGEPCGLEAPDRCGAGCVDLQSDPGFCGSCERSCQPGEVCVEGTCATECSGSKPLECAGRCVDPRSDRQHCGGCDTLCAAGELCNDGVCDRQCSGATPVVCGGLCVDDAASPSACGSCNVRCKAGAVCADGTCAGRCRDAQKTQCGDVCVDLATDPNHCGACSRRCALGEYCSDGVCETSCGGTTPILCGSRCVRIADADGCGSCPASAPDTCELGCVNLAADPINCGACGKRCGSDELCAGGVCSVDCARMPDACAVDRCEGPASEPCGNCGIRTRTCSDGTWSAWSECLHERACAPDSTEACGSGGERTCRADCQWSECQGQTCDGAASEACGNCGTRARSCDNGSWSEWSACSDEGACAPAVTEACGSGGQRMCGADCTWSECTGQTCEGPTVEACGSCGTRARTCNNGAWSEWSDCGGQGVCAPGAALSCESELVQRCGGQCSWCACENHNQVPLITDPDAASGVSRSGAFGAAEEAWLAFDATNSQWISALRETPAWIGYAWSDAPRFIASYAITYANGDIRSRAPRTWTLEGRNGGDWVVLDTRLDEVNWAGLERREYSVAAPSSYREYRLHVTQDNDPRAGIEVISIGRFELIGATCP